MVTYLTVEKPMTLKYLNYFHGFKAYVMIYPRRRRAVCNIVLSQPVLYRELESTFVVGNVNTKHSMDSD